MTDLETQIRAACERAGWDEAATLAIRSYGPELLGFLAALARDPVVADDLFGSVCEKLWRGLPKFAWKSSFRTWAYAIARNEHVSYRRGGKREVPMLPSSASRRTVREGSACRVRSRRRPRSRRARRLPT